MDDLDQTAATPTFTARANVLEHEGTWRLTPDALELRGGPTAGPDVVVRFAYRDVTGVRLSFAPSRFDSVRYRCDLQMRSGQCLAILSTHYAGPATFEDRAAAYAPFVRGLIGRVAAANPSARLRAGKNPLVYVAEHAFLFVAVVLLILLLSEIGFLPLGGSVLVKIVIIIAAVPLLVAYARKNWPRRFQPDAIPESVLPSSA